MPVYRLCFACLLVWFGLVWSGFLLKTSKQANKKLRQSHVDQAGLELLIFLLHHLLSVGITGVCHHAELDLIPLYISSVETTAI